MLVSPPTLRPSHPPAHRSPKHITMLLVLSNPQTRPSSASSRTPTPSPPGTWPRCGWRRTAPRPPRACPRPPRPQRESGCCRRPGTCPSPACCEWLAAGQMFRAFGVHMFVCEADCACMCARQTACASSSVGVDVCWRSAGRHDEPPAHTHLTRASSNARSTALIPEWDGCPPSSLWADQFCAGGSGYLASACQGNKGARTFHAAQAAGAPAGGRRCPLALLPGSLPCISAS